MDLSIIIVNYRAWDDLALCLSSLVALKQSASPTCEVLVVDNASGDGFVELFERRFPWAQFLANKDNFGYAHGCNLGAAAASGEQLLFLNPDCRDPGGQIERLLALKLAAPEVSILAPRQVDLKGRPRKVADRFPGLLMLFGPARALARAVSPRRFPDARKPSADLQRVDWVSGSALMISAESLRRLKGWCDQFWLYSEDVDLCRRAANAGMAAAVAGDVCLIHRHGASTRATPAVSALTRGETVISKHLYAHRHLPGPRGWLYHALLIAARYLPRALPALLAPLVPLRRVRIEAEVFIVLSRYYLGVAGSGRWVGPRSVRARAQSSLYEDG